MASVNHISSHSPLATEQAGLSPEGLSSSLAAQRLREYGENVLTPPKRRSLLLQFIDKFKDPLIIILMVVLVLSATLSAYEYLALEADANVLYEPLGIFIAITLATLIGFAVEVNASKKFDVLNATSDETPVKVIRDGRITQVARRHITVGDVVLLDAGDVIPADGTLTDSVALSVNESSFTGEPLVHKSHLAEQADENATYPTNRLLRGAIIADGHGTMLVDRVGDATEYGKIYADAQIENQQKTPLTKQFDKLGRLISRFSYIIGVFIIVGRLALYWFDGGDITSISGLQYLIDTTLIAVTLVVASIPEGLPMSVTLSLALSMRRMLLSNNLVRRLHACETMGATTVICTDKTGTLTQNQMQVQNTNFLNMPADGKLSDNDIVTLSIACNSTAHLEQTDDKTNVIGNPTEGALLLWLSSQGIDYMKVRADVQILEQVPFSTEHKYMATLVSMPGTGKRVLLAKGASEILFEHCSDIDGNATREAIMQQLLDYQNKAMRTLGFAYKVLGDKDPSPISDGLLVARDLTFMGTVAISDPVRPDAPDAISRCIDAGIQVKIVTGDTPATAREIGRQVGLWTDNDDAQALISGPEWAALSDEEAAKRAHVIKIMSRARPEDKARLVRLLQQQGEVVAVTGDGTNDAPALNAAQVGLSMGDGTSVAKEASDITIIDNSFSSINKAVMWGRSLYKNIQRFILFQLTVNVAACLLVGLCSFFSEQPPLTVTQMLWVNLIMDTFAALALASLPPSEGVMRDKPRRNDASIITRSMRLSIGITGISFTVVMTALFILFKFGHYDSQNFAQSGITPYEVSIFFTTFVMLQFWNLFNAKAFESGESAFSNLKGSKVFMAIMATILIGQILIVQFGGTMFGVEPISIGAWIAIVMSTSLVLIAGEVVRFWHHRKTRSVKC